MAPTIRGLAALFVGLCAAWSSLQVLADGWQIDNVNVIDVRDGAVLTGRDVRIENGRITAIGPGGTLPEPPVKRVDGAGGYLIPGLTEMHAHVPSSAQGEQRIRDVLTLFLANGVTTIRGMLGEPAHLELRERLARGEIDGPRLITSGPSFNGNTVSSPEQAGERVREQAAAGYDFLKIHPGLTRAEFIALATAAREAGIPFAGHVSFDTGIETALRHGQDSVDHLDAYAEAMVPADHPLHGVAPAFFGLNLADAMDPALAPALARATAAAGTWQVPTETLFENIAGPLSLDALQARPGMAFVGAETLGDWSAAVTQFRSQMTEAQRERFLFARRSLLLELHRAGAGILLGSDAPQIMNVPGHSLHQELALYVQIGLTPLEALQTGTVNVARYFGEESGRGRVAEGMAADLVLLEANPLEDIGNTTAILGVARNGAWYARETLARMLDGVRERGL